MNPEPSEGFGEGADWDSNPQPLASLTLASFRKRVLGQRKFAHFFLCRFVVAAANRITRNELGYTPKIILDNWDPSEIWARCFSSVQGG